MIQNVDKPHITRSKNTNKFQQVEFGRKLSVVDIGDWKKSRLKTELEVQSKQNKGDETSGHLGNERT